MQLRCGGSGGLDVARDQQDLHASGQQVGAVQAADGLGQDTPDRRLRTIDVALLQAQQCHTGLRHPTPGARHLVVPLGLVDVTA